MKNLNEAMGRGHKVGATLYKEPNSMYEYYSHDNEGAFEYGGQGRDPLTKHLIQDIHWDKTPVSYEFNSLGLRGPEPDYNADTRILFVGGSLVHGVGVNVEDSFPYKVAKAMNASYINVSDTDSFTDLFDEIEEYMFSFEPHYLVMGDTRFFDEFGYAWRMLFKDANVSKETRKVVLNELRPLLANRNKKVLELLLYKIHNLYKGVPSVFITSDRKDFAFGDGLLTYSTRPMHLTSDHFVDLGRDNRHGGPKTHDIITRQLLDLLSH